MTNLDDFDGALEGFLRDGPTIAPEPPVIAAMAHARTTPRRRDPLAALRRDVMARPIAVGGLRPGIVLAAAALVLAAIGLAVVGAGRGLITPPAPSVPSVPSVPSATPRVSGSPGASPTETPHPSEGPTATSSPLPRITTLPPLGAPSVPAVHVALLQCCNGTVSVDVVDESGHLVRAASGPAVEGGSVEDVTVANDTPRTLRITWLGSPCDTVHRLTIDPSGTTITIDRPSCAGDATPADRIVILTFDRDVAAGAVTAGLVTGRGGVDLPSWTATGIDKAGDVYRFSLFDPSQTVARVEPVDVTDIADFDPTTVDRSQESPDTIRLLWYGKACLANAALRLDSTGLDWTLDQGSSTACATPALRGMDLTFTGPLDLSTLR